MIKKQTLIFKLKTGFELSWTLGERNNTFSFMPTSMTVLNSSKPTVDLPLELVKENIIEAEHKWEKELEVILLSEHQTDKDDLSLCFEDEVPSEYWYLDTEYNTSEFSMKNTYAKKGMVYLIRQSLYGLLNKAYEYDEELARAFLKHKTTKSLFNQEKKDDK